MAQYAHLAEDGKIPRYIPIQDHYKVVLLKYDRRTVANVKTQPLCHTSTIFKESIQDDEDPDTIWDMHEVMVSKTKCKGYLWRVDDENRANAIRIIVEDRVFAEILRPLYMVNQTQYLIHRNWDESLTPGQPVVVDISGGLKLEDG